MGVRLRTRAAAALAAATALVFAAAPPARAGQTSTSPATRDWPGTEPAQLGDAAGALGGNISGLVPAGPAALWAVRDAPGQLLALDLAGETWSVRPGWGTGRTLTYPDGHAGPDAEAVTSVDGEEGVVYVGSERDNSDPTKPRNSILRYETGTSGVLRATTEWRLDHLLDAAGPNTGIEGLAWVPDQVVVAAGLQDRTGRPYQPSQYAAHHGGVFVVAVEQQRTLSIVLLREDGGADLLASVASGLPSVMELHWDAEDGALWAFCDNTCEGAGSVLVLRDGSFLVDLLVRPPRGTASLNQEGFARTPCRDGRSSAVWSDDSASGGHALRTSVLPCGAVFATPAATAATAVPRSAGAAPPESSPAVGAPATGSRFVDAWVAVLVGVLLAVASALLLARGRRRHRVGDDPEDSGRVPAGPARR
jgi:hypothetical protein